MNMTQKANEVLKIYGKHAFDSRLMQTDCTEVVQTKGKLIKSQQVHYELSKRLSMQIVSRRACHFYIDLLRTYIPWNKDNNGKQPQGSMLEQLDQKIVANMKLLHAAIALSEKLYAKQFDTPEFDGKVAGMALLLSQKIKWVSKKEYGLVVGYVCTELNPLTEAEVKKVKSFARETDLLLQYHTQKENGTSSKTEPTQSP